MINLNVFASKVLSYVSDTFGFMPFAQTTIELFRWRRTFWGDSDVRIEACLIDT